jgi:hypothetical protein
MKVGPPSQSCSIGLVIVTSLSQADMDWWDLMSLRALSPAQLEAPHEDCPIRHKHRGKGKDFQELGQVFNWTATSDSGIGDLSGSCLEDVQVTLPQPLLPSELLNSGRSIGRTLAPYTKGSACRSALWRGRRHIVTGGNLSPHYVSQSSFRAAGPVSTLAVGVGGVRPSSSSGWRRGLGRQPGQGACLKVSLDTGNVEVCGCEVMGVGSVCHGVPSQPFSCCVHLFGPQLSNQVEISLKSKHQFP